MNVNYSDILWPCIYNSFAFLVALRVLSALVVNVFFTSCYRLILF
jgi:hypothetical protein